MNTEVRDMVCSFDNLYKAMKKCRHNVMWKDSVASYVDNGLINCLKLRESILDDRYKLNPYSIFYIHEPKERKIVSTRLKDRVLQRSLCDNYLTPIITKSFIYDNCACQLNKGTQFARQRLKCHIQRFYRKHGTNGYVLKCDLSDYFGSTSHELAIATVKRYIKDEWALKETTRVINSFVDGENPTIGMGLGSQMTQLIQLAVLDDIDHYIKERLHIKHYIRYMDDFILIHESKEYLLYCKQVIGILLENKGLRLSKKKTQVFELTQPIKFLGFTYWVKQSGKVIMRLNKDKISHERRKLKRQIARAEKGYMTYYRVEQCYISWKAHAHNGNSFALIGKMNRYYKRNGGKRYDKSNQSSRAVSERTEQKQGS